MIFRIEVAPAVHLPRSRGATFSYTHGQSLPKGSLVRISFGRQSSILGIVYKSSELTARPPYPLKSIDEVLGSGAFLPKQTLALIAWEATATVTSLGDTQKQALPAWLRIAGRRKDVSEIVFAESKTIHTKKVKPQLINTKLSEQIKAYKEHSKTAIKAKSQLLILAPSATVQAKLLNDLSQAIAAPFGVTKKAMQIWLRIRAGEPIIIVGTKNALRLPFTNLHSIILHDEGSDLYKENRSHPYTDAREAAKQLAKIHGASYVASGILPSFETLHDAEEKPHFPKTHTKLVIIDLSDTKPTNGLAKPLSDALADLSTKRTDAKAFIYMNRRGDALALTCRDCDYVFTCKNCDAPMPVYKASRIDPKATDGMRLRCRHCSEIFIPPLVCPQCRGFSLRPRGLAGAALEEGIRRIAPSATILRMDGDTAASSKAQHKIIQSFKNAKGPAILIGTKMALTHSLTEMDVVAVPAFDQLGALPDFRADEATLRTLITLSHTLKTKGSFFIQAWHSSRPILKTFKTGEIEKFIKYELSMREQFGWPPFSRVAKLSFEHRSHSKGEKSANKLAAELHELPEVEIIGPTPAFIPKINGKYRWVILLKWKDFYSNPAVEEKLSSLVPQSWDIDVSPTSIL